MPLVLVLWLASDEIARSIESGLSEGARYAQLRILELLDYKTEASQVINHEVLIHCPFAQSIGFMFEHDLYVFALSKKALKSTEYLEFKPLDIYF